MLWAVKPIPVAHDLRPLPMNAPDSFVAGAVYYYGSMENLAKVLTRAGIEVSIGIWALRIPSFARAFKTCPRRQHYL